MIEPNFMFMFRDTEFFTNIHDVRSFQNQRIVQRLTKRHATVTMRTTRKWIKYTISAGILCFTSTLYLLCVMAPPGLHPPKIPPDGQGQPLLDVQKRNVPRDHSVGSVVSTSTDHQITIKVWPKPKEPFELKQDQPDTKGTKTSECRGDCTKLKRLFKNWPKSKPKALIYYLTRATRLNELKRSLESVEQYFNFVYHYPIVIFHESDLTESIPAIKGWTNSSLYFQLVTFSLPDFLIHPVTQNIPCRSTIGYRHMCRFNAKLVYEHPIMKWVEYVWRLDDESILTDKIRYDVLDFMRNKNMLYGYIWEHVDAKNCVTDLWNSTERYVQEHNIIPRNPLSQWKSPKLYYNNFEVSSMALWRSREYRSFIEYVDRLGGIYYHRWGDAPIKGIAVNLFVPKTQLHHFKDVHYQHNTFSNPWG